MDSYSTPSVLELKFLAKLEISELKEVIKKSTDKMEKLIAEDRLEKIESFVVKKEWINYYHSRNEEYQFGAVIAIEFLDVDDDYVLQFDETFVNKK